MTEEREIRCRRTIDGKAPCPWRGPKNTADEHTAESGHEICAVCRLFLADHEQQTCSRCVSRTRDQLAEIVDAYATLPAVIERAGYHMSGQIPGGSALVMFADGSVDSLRPYRPDIDAAEPITVIRPAMHGDHLIHPAHIEIRTPPNAREHFGDHWKKDPPSVLAVLEAIERSWRRDLQHPPAEDIATVSGSVDYLLRWLPTAARQCDTFADNAREIRALHGRLTHVAGLANDPEVAEAECFDCGGELEREYGAKGLVENWECARCHRVYKQAEYYLALRQVLQLDQWRSVRDAAHALGLPVQRLRNWADRGQVVAACRVYERITVVWWPDVVAVAQNTESDERKEAS